MRGPLSPLIALSIGLGIGEPACLESRYPHQREDDADAHHTNPGRPSEDGEISSSDVATQPDDAAADTVTSAADVTPTDAPTLGGEDAPTLGGEDVEVEDTHVAPRDGAVCVGTECPNAQIAVTVTLLTLRPAPTFCIDASSDVGPQWTIGAPDRRATENGASMDATLDQALAHGALCGQSRIDFAVPCDAEPTETWIRVWLHGVYDGDGTALGEGTWTNPCTSPSGCMLGGACTGGERLTLDLALKRSAEPGFFDHAVDLDGILCSARISTCEGGTPAGTGNGEMLKTLTDRDGQPTNTVRIAFDCIDPRGTAKPLLMLMPDVVVSCVFDSGAGPGGGHSYGLSYFYFAMDSQNQGNLGGLFLDTRTRYSAGTVACPRGECTTAQVAVEVAVDPNQSSACRIAGAIAAVPFELIGELRPGGFQGSDHASIFPSIHAEAEFIDDNGDWPCREVTVGDSDVGSTDTWQKYDVFGAYYGLFDQVGDCNRFLSSESAPNRLDRTDACPRSF